ncbi:acetylglutamate kinase [Hymenobacter sp. UV11]|uniref:acetylglutamate kinase n=1 Tax=Hymenobacter sp. UV11 TaxID=1849735 RepID=UPI00105FEAD1|nr:acetylglutamate kinase [Hymenobacter sp. UV11]TDN38222.1 acetylglutamate kinase [Hymenobacter sp. UV11]TFZ67602.1 acetylglutamate kinase [Hymenobacter sp. UV11]
MNKQEVTIYKIGGGIIDDAAELTKFLALLAQVAGPKILVHGGGKGASTMMRELGMEPQLINGRRITDAATLDIVTMFYAGKTNKQVVAELQKQGINALGLSGADGNIIRGHKRPVKDIDYGFVGDLTPASVNVTLLQTLLAANITPVLCPIIHDGQGQLLNTNADTIASAVAVALAAEYEVTLHYCFEKNGVLRDVTDDNSVIPEINSRTYAELKQQGIIADGMLPKLENAFSALNQGVAKVIIGHALNIGSDLRTLLCLN